MPTRWIPRDDFNEKFDNLIKQFMARADRDEAFEKKKYDDQRSDAYSKKVNDDYALMMGRTPELKAQELKNAGEIAKEKTHGEWEIGKEKESNIGRKYTADQLLEGTVGKTGGTPEEQYNRLLMAIVKSPGAAQWSIDDMHKLARTLSEKAPKADAMVKKDNLNPASTEPVKLSPLIDATEPTITPELQGAEQSYQRKKFKEESKEPFWKRVGMNMLRGGGTEAGQFEIPDPNSPIESEKRIFGKEQQIKKSGAEIEQDTLASTFAARQKKREEELARQSLR